MKQYTDLVQDILTNGVSSDDRTGTGTRSVFGRQFKFNLAEGFPLLTTKKTWWKGVLIELLWILQGQTNVSWLKSYGVHIWDKWADKNGELGPVYGMQLRKWEGIEVNRIKTFDIPDQSSIKGTHVGIGLLGNIDSIKMHPMYSKMYYTWYHMIKRCYHKKSHAYKSYGGRGIFVDTRWLTFTNFFADIQKLENWSLKMEYPDDYSLDKDFYQSNKYGPDTCRWASSTEQSVNIRSNTNFFEAEDPNGHKTIHYGLKTFCKKYNFNSTAISPVLKGEVLTNYKWKFKKLPIPEGYIARYKEIDQLRNIISEIKHNPSSRRIVYTLWNVTDLPRMSLVPCTGIATQFYVREGKLSCATYQRSADVFLGVPFDIASYACLVHLIAAECNLLVGDLIYNFGDAHIYNNHLDQCREMLTREPKQLPKLTVNLAMPLLDFLDRVKFMDWDEIQTHVSLTGYDPHPAIKGELSV